MIGSASVDVGGVGKGWKGEGMDGDKVLALMYGSLSALMTAVHAVLVKSAVRTLEGSVLKLTYWSNFLSGAFLVRFTFLVIVFLFLTISTLSPPSHLTSYAD